MKNNKYIIIPFFIIIFGFSILNIIKPEKRFSISENRNLEKKPTIEDIKNNTYNQKFETYFNDQFILRDEFININKKTEKNLNKSEVGNYYLGKENWILGKFSKIINEEDLIKYSDTLHELSEFSKELGSDVYYVSTPHKTNILKHLYPKYVDNKNNIDINVNNLKSNLESDLINFIDIDEYFFNTFTENELENLYFKTDHHWNSLGAFEGFKGMINKMDMNISKEKLDKHFNKYERIMLKDKDFIGSYNKNLDMMIDEQEYIDYVYKKDSKYKYYITDDNNTKEVKEENILYTSRNKKNIDYGGAYLRGANCNILTIENKEALIEESILIFRDSYQAPTTWLFADLFNEVTIVDPRNIDNISMSYEDIIKNSKPDKVIFMYNSYGFDQMIRKMDERM